MQSDESDGSGSVKQSGEKNPQLLADGGSDLQISVWAVKVGISARLPLRHVTKQKLPRKAGPERLSLVMLNLQLSISPA